MVQKIHLPQIDFQKIFESSPDLYLILNSSYHIVAASNSYLKATHVKRESVLNRYIFDVFPDDPRDMEATGIRNLKASLDRVYECHLPDTMAVQKYSILGTGKNANHYEIHYWSPVNIPILNDQNELMYIIHRVQDVTDFLNLQKNNDEYEKKTGVLEARTIEMEQEIYQRAQEIQKINQELRETNIILAYKSVEMESLYKELEKLLRLKTDLFANISHELRTPLTLILGYLKKILNQYGHLDELSDILKNINDNAEILLKEVNDLLDIAKSDAGKEIMYYEEVDIAQLFKLSFECFHSVAAERNINYTIQTPDSVLAQIDIHKIKKIFNNMLANAFKFVDNNGKIECILNISHSSAHIIIADNGPGIEPELRECIFDRFYQSPLGRHQRYNGTGLGLAIVKDYVNLHHGSISVTKTVGGGATFEIIIPLMAPLHACVNTLKHNHITVDSEDMHYTRGIIRQLKPELSHFNNYQMTSDRPFVLIVEDNQEMSNFIADILIDQFNIITASNGQEALDILAVTPIDLILSDIMMPLLGGDQLVYEIRKLPQYNDIAIILLSAKADGELRLSLLRNGAQDYVEKPFLEDELKARITNLINLKLAKDEIKETVNELILANEELDTFNRTISHDLRNPIQAILTFSSILLEQNLLDHNIIEIINDIHLSAKHMEQLITDLLIFSQSSKTTLNLQIFNISDLIKSIIYLYQKQYPRHNIHFNIHENVMINADPSLIRIVFDNLIANAWKYSSKKSKPSIEFGYDEHHACMYIRDNGVGFHPDQYSQLFIPFSRLHHHEFPGTGIGLATVKRIIDRHKGKIWAESQINQGATFYIILENMMPSSI